MKPRKKRQLTKTELRALATPGLILHRVDREGRARLEQVTPEASPFLHTKPTLPTEKKNNERGEV